MDGLRWLLLLFGALVVLGVYLYSRRQEKLPDDVAASGERVEPTLGGGEIASTETSPTPEPDVSPVTAETEVPIEADVTADETPPQQPQKIVTLRLVARDRGTFAGDELILSLRGIGMRHGRFGIYHRVDGDDDRRTIFSAASLVEPGSFDLDKIREQSIPGISLFLILPCPIEGVDAFDMMMEAARTLSQSLDGELLDESGSTLSIQRERYMREEIVQFTHANQIME